MKKTKLALLLITALLVGVCIGFFTNSAIIRARIRQFSQIPANMPERITQRLTDRLELNAEQQKQVLAVFVAYEGRMSETREKSRAMFDTLMQEMTAQVDQYLTPSQVEEHKQMLEELDQRMRNNRALLRAFSPPPATNSGK
jgi:hypothetical protein